MINIDKGVSIILHDWLNVQKDEMIHFITDETHLQEAEAIERWAYGADAALKTTILNSQLVQKGDVIESMTDIFCKAARPARIRPKDSGRLCKSTPARLPIEKPTLSDTLSGRSVITALEAAVIMEETATPERIMTDLDMPAFRAIRKTRSAEKSAPASAAAFLTEYA